MVSSDDESFTYNKRVNRLATIQEHYMIVNLVGRGISPDRLARALAVDVRAICDKRNLLVGINPDVADLLKAKHIGQGVFQKLRKMKDLRQLEVAEQMARLEHEMSSLNADYKQFENSYAEELVLVVASVFLQRLLSKPEIGRFLETRHPEFS